MKASKFTDAPKAFIIRHSEESTTIAEICRKAGAGKMQRSLVKKSIRRV